MLPGEGNESSPRLLDDLVRCSAGCCSATTFPSLSLSLLSLKSRAVQKAREANSMGNFLPIISKFTDGEENDRIAYAVSSMQGFGDEMEDAHAAILNLDDTTDTSFFGVYDGHGGADVASYCARQFHIDLRNHEDYHNNVTNAMKSVFFSMDEKLQQSDEWRELVNPRGSCCMCANLLPFPQATYTGPAFEGSTVSAVLIRGNRIIVGNVGDSRCVLSRNGQAIDLSTDHKPDSSSELERVENSGGRFTGTFCKKVLESSVITTKDEWGYYNFDGRVTVSRAIGDFAFKQNKNLPPAEQMLICNPDMRTVGITDDAEFLLIASAGIWDCMSSQAVVNFVRQRLQSDRDLRAICEDLLDRCLESGQNMTAILVQFKIDGAANADIEENAGVGADGEADADIEENASAGAGSDGEADADIEENASAGAGSDGQAHANIEENASAGAGSDGEAAADIEENASASASSDGEAAADIEENASAGAGSDGEAASDIEEDEIKPLLD